MIDGKTIAVTVPAYNESKLIGAAISGIPEFVDMVIVVDDASTDDTVNRVPAHHFDREVILVRHPENRGVGAAIATGYAAALERSADIVAVMAGDAQMDPADLLFLLQPVLRGEAEYAKGDRLAWPGVAKAMPRMRFVGNHVLSVLTRVTAGYGHIRDSQCGYTAVTADALRLIDLDALYPRYGFPNDMLAKLHAASARVVNVPVRPIYGEEVSGISLYTALVRVPMVLLRSMMWRWKTERHTPRLPSAATVTPSSLEPVDG
jgi:glycosyltransferase involved in cell wall biosynthesis